MAMNCIPGPCEEDPDEDPDEDQEEYEQGKSDLSSWEPGPDSFDSEITDLDLGEEFVDARDGSLSEEGWFSDVFGNSLSTVLKSANIQLDSPQCSFSFQINLFRVTDSLTFDFCPYKEFLSNLGKFFVSIATLTSVMIIIGRG
ncbi:MAG: hypothetical protein GY795_46235 [Desulfobacterales bacterium]|nr:hypothetical protein [Desulfobacterales bacterium]